MTKRVVAVELSARVAEYKKGMYEAAHATRQVGTEGEKLAQTRQAMMQLGTGSLAMGTLLAAGVGVAVARFAQFDQAMSAVSATGEDAKQNIDALREAAIQAGSDTVYSATEAANAIEELAKAGVEAKDILGGGLKGALDLAAAGGLGVAEAAGIAATTMKQFRLEGGEATHVADLLAAGSSKAMGDVTDMGQALNQAGLVSNQFGLSVEESVATLTAFASAGMLGSDAGTSMRTMLLRLANPTEEVKDLMAELGINAYDTQGNFVGMAGLAGELETSLSGMTEQQKQTTLAMIFGQDAIRGATILLEEGKTGIQDWTDAVDEQGFAAKMASERLDNLAGDWEKLTGAIDAALITMGSGADGPLRAFVQALTGLVDGFNDLPDWMQQSVLIMAILTSGALLLGGAFLVGTIKAAEFKVALDQLGLSGGRFGPGFGWIA
jgi:TP901 family phage tail tape measure protein